MLEKVLLATNFQGKLHKLSLETLECDIVDNILQISKVNGFKRIVTTPTCAWAVCADQNIYFCVLETDLPIKVGESCYENERWSMSYGWSEKSLLFSDRWHWSSKDGKNERKPELINLPSEDWCWEGNWIVDKSINCDSEGWQYAFDFPAKYHSEPGKISFVRRRKWIRYRKFISYNKWSALTEGFVAEKSAKNITAIPEINAPEDLYQDISVGGFQLQGQQPGYLAVWAITFSGRVLYRAGITRTCPQGELWLEVKSDNINFLQISVGPDGHLWGCTWDGYAVVRQGVSHKCQIGTSWREVDCPKGEEFQQVAVGKNVVWGLSKNKKIFFRGGLTNKNEIGEKWIEMIGVFSFVNIGPNNQVFALSEDGHNIYVRTNVTPDELVGREWKLIKFSTSGN